MQEIETVRYKSKKATWIENVVIILVIIYSFWCEKISLYPSYDVKYWLIKISFIICMTLLLRRLLTYI